MKGVTTLVLFFVLSATLFSQPAFAQGKIDVTEAQIKEAANDENYLAIHKTFQEINEHFIQTLAKASDEQLQSLEKTSIIMIGEGQLGALSASEERKLLKELTGLSDKDANKLGKRIAQFQKQYPAFNITEEIDEIDLLIVKNRGYTGYEALLEALNLTQCQKKCKDNLLPPFRKQLMEIQAAITVAPNQGMRSFLIRFYNEFRVTVIEEYRACARACLPE